MVSPVSGPPEYNNIVTKTCLAKTGTGFGRTGIMASVEQYLPRLSWIDKSKTGPRGRFLFAHSVPML
jgi:hypothetical protein